MSTIKSLYKGALALLCLFSCNEGSQNDQALIKRESMTVSQMQALTDSNNGQNKEAADFNTEEYSNIVENNFLSAIENPQSTFSIDVDRAAYSNVRRIIQNGALPPKGAVRIEEMINYFDYNYTAPTNDDPLNVHTEIASCPWNTKHKLVHIGLKGKEISKANLPPANLVFLVDVSGSMDEANKLPLVRASMNLLVDQLRDNDRIAIVVYAGAAGLVLPSTKGSDKTKIKEAIGNLQAGGSTAGAEGIKLAYKIAAENFVKEGNNRVILATDGDFNVGASSEDELVNLIEEKRKSNIFLTVLGYGMGNYKDSKMQQLADKGNGNHAYIDNINEAKKTLVKEFGSTIFTIAKDVKLQVEFNPAKVKSYRLIGYENRMLAKEDFNDDKKDAGEMGAGHTVTALYEIIPAGVTDEFTGSVDDLKYQSKPVEKETYGNELMNIKIRYKEPAGDISKLMVQPVVDTNSSWENASENFRFSSSVAAFGMLLRNSAYKQKASYEAVLSLAKNSKGNDKDGYRSEFVELVQTASSLALAKNE